MFAAVLNTLALSPGLSPRALPPCAHRPPLSVAMDASRDPIDSVADPRAFQLAALREQAERWLGLCSAITLTEEEGLQPFQSPSGWLAGMSPPPAQAYTQEELVTEIEAHEPPLYALLDACADRAPSLCRTASTLPLARLAAWTSDRWVRPLDEWTGEDGDEDTASDGNDDNDDAIFEAEAERRAEAALRSLTSHLLERWDVPKALHGALTYTDGPPISEAAHRTSKAFLVVHAGAGSGDASVLVGLRASVAPSVTKAAAKQFSQLGAESRAANPLHALRRAQVASLGGAPWMGEAACASRLADAIGTAEEEGFALSALQWAVRHEEALREEYTARSVIDFFLEMRQVQPGYSCAGRTPKTVAAALEAYTASTFLEEGSDEKFQPNPRGLRGMFELGATIPEDTCVRVPYDGKYALGGEGQPGHRAATVRVAEVLSLRRLFYEGEQLLNCLEGSRRSQSKYLSRARARVSSFWSLTRQEPGGKVEHLCLIEVWHLNDSNVVRQAEGPRPRTIPSAEAWYWMDKWCEREGVDLSTWDCYS